ncbi:MAG TPA: Bax inhibitor-1 family protein [Candidatus Bathyarchaeia archaeon]|nr:Bax inhibitor-1 family protein [Candidatus Bathyarchaeia archaeon]
MVDILFARTFLIVGAMLIITTITSRINKVFETAAEMWGTIIGTFVFLFSIVFFAKVYPLNLFLVAIFSGLMGWQIGPTIEYIGKRFRIKKQLKARGIIIKKGEKIPEQALKEIEQSMDGNQYQREWHNIVFQTLSATSFAVFATAGTVFLTSFDFSFLGSFLFVALTILIVMGLINIFFFRSSFFSLMQAYFGAVIFTLYLFYDFDRLEKMAGDDSWASAIDISVNIYLDIINLFLDLLQILAESSD